jgi:hypothetical protein
LSGFEYGVLGGGDYYSVGAWLKLLPVDSENLPNVLRPAYTKYYEQMQLQNQIVLKYLLRNQDCHHTKYHFQCL